MSSDSVLIPTMQKITIWNRLLDTIQPRFCCICDRRLGVGERAICAGCALQLPRTHFGERASDNPMTLLFQGIVPVEKAVALTYFTPHSPAARLIYDIKYRRHPDYAVFVGELMAAELSPTGFFSDIDVLVPVPLSHRRLRQRGYNQSERIAYGISSTTAIPVLTTVLQRKQFLKSQTTLGRFDRHVNVGEMFELADAAPLSGRHILLIDDVCTTGATLMACIETIQAATEARYSILTFGLTDH